MYSASLIRLPLSSARCSRQLFTWASPLATCKRLCASSLSVFAERLCVTGVLQGPACSTLKRGVVFDALQNVQLAAARVTYFQDRVLLSLFNNSNFWPNASGDAMA